MAKKKQNDIPQASDERDEGAPKIEVGGHLGEDMRRVAIGLAVCGAILVLMKLSGM